MYVHDGEFGRALRGTPWSRFVKALRRLFGLRKQRRRPGTPVLADGFERRAALKRAATAEPPQKAPAKQ